MTNKNRVKKCKKKCLTLTEKLIKNHSDTWLKFFEAGFDDAISGKPIQESGDFSMDDDLERYAKLFGKALYAKGYEVGGEAFK